MRLCGTAAVFLALWTAAPAAAQDVQHLSYRFGPIAVRPGQNGIVTRENPFKPTVDGYITSITPNLMRADGSVPHVTQIHLHHGVWLVNGQPTFASGEEKTILRMPPGYGWLHRACDRWDMNYMVHNLTSAPDTVFITYAIDFVPLSSPTAMAIRPVRTLSVDVAGGVIYPVFDALRGTGGGDGRLTYPDEQPNLPVVRKRRNQWPISEDGALIAAYGHLHPGGLWTELRLTRNGRTVRLFRSDATYFDPRGPVSWDLAMAATPPDWRVRVQRGDVLSVSATYETRRASWYESMGIMPVLFDPGGTGADPFTTAVDRPGQVTHGRLAENIDRSGRRNGLADARRLPSAALRGSARVTISRFVYLLLPRPPVHARRLPRHPARCGPTPGASQPARHRAVIVDWGRRPRDERRADPPSSGARPPDSAGSAPRIVGSTSSARGLRLCLGGDAAMNRAICYLTVYWGRGVTTSAKPACLQALPDRRAPDLLPIGAPQKKPGGLQQRTALLAIGF